jgi:dolichol-phosphate mannosyltransferase
MDASFPIDSRAAGRRPTRVRLANPGTELTIVVPTLDERENIIPLVEKIDAALPDTTWEVIFVDDDSRDGTADAVRVLARRDARVRCIQRIGRRGLSTACIEGVLASSSQYIAVMDADLQHDERLLPEMLQALRSRSCDLAVGSRYVAGGGVGEWNSGRAIISFLAIRLSQAICRVPIADPMSGFFMVRRDLFEGAVRRLSGRGFKILLDLMASSPRELRVKELPFHFRPRQHGRSKLDTMVAWEFVILLLEKLAGGRLPGNALIAACVIASGVALYLGAHSLVRLCGASVLVSKFAASGLSAAAIFFLNQLFTHRDRRLAGARLRNRLLLFFGLTGAIAFLSLNAIGAILNTWSESWLASLAGASVIALSSYVVAQVLSRSTRFEPAPDADGDSTSAHNQDYAVSAELDGDTIAPLERDPTT